MKKLGLVLMCALAFVLLSCDATSPIEPDPDPKPDPEPLQDGIWPLRVGASWTYKRVTPGFPKVDTIKFVVPRKFVSKQTGEESYFIHRYDNGFIRDTTYQWTWSNRNDGLYQTAILSASDTMDVSMNHRPYPATLGTVGGDIFVSFETEKITPVDTLLSPLISTNETLETPAGSFTTYVYRTVLPKHPQTNFGKILRAYLAPHVGVVGWQIYSEADTTVLDDDVRLLVYDLLD